MGLISLHSDAIWVEECIHIIFQDRGCNIQRFIHKFLEVYLDEWMVFILLKEHASPVIDVGQDVN
jgi:hypothetical protein